ncbi:hypothetical protein GQ53DRAFT_876875 [Thozetella sp. PMI_491]|nr:hypothetical protein GQ53DRAFT_876875 [Thozetella sp. PMI_491]
MPFHQDPYPASGEPPSYNPDQPEPPPENPRKRKRIPIACGACRARKSRCDGARPKCSGCIAQNVECVYATHPIVSFTGTGLSIGALESRLLALEQEVQEIKHTQHVNGSQAAEIADEHEVPPGEVGDDTSSGISPEVTDGVGTLEFSVQPQPAFFGPSSNIAFTRLIRRYIFSQLHDSEPTHPKESGGDFPFHRRDQLAVSGPPSPSHTSPPPIWSLGSSPSTTHFPPQEEVVRLVLRFFSNTAMLFPYIHEDSFWKTFNVAAESGFRGVRSSWLGLLYMILAMATITAPDTTETTQQAALSDSFFTFAESLRPNPRTGDAGLERIQVMLLMVQYLQGTRRSIQTWTVHGHAVRLAIQLGLHSNETLKQCDPLEQEVRVRTWYCCILLDRTLSLTFGRPPTIPDHYIRIRLPIHVLNLGSNDSPTYQPTPWCAEECSSLFLNATITLYQILNKVLDSLYESNLSSGALLTVAEMASFSLSAEQELQKWRSLLPSSIVLIRAPGIPSNNEGTLQHKLRAVLTLRFYNTRILTHRPLLDRFLQLIGNSTIDEHETATLTQLMELSTTMCLESAESIIDLVYTVITPVNRQREYLGAWWFTLYYTFNAALAVAATLLCSKRTFETLPNTTRNPSDRANSLLERAISCLSLLESNSRMADKCSRFMIAIRYYIHVLRESCLLLPLLRYFYAHMAKDRPSKCLKLRCPDHPRAISIEGDSAFRVSPAGIAGPQSQVEKRMNDGTITVDWPLMSFLDFSLPESDITSMTPQELSRFITAEHAGGFDHGGLLL